MNEHIRIRRVVEGLRSHLKSQDFGETFRSLLANYNNSCRQLKQRLEQVDGILLSGNVSGALKMAETDPSVLDLLTLLGFPESQDLKDWCEANGVSFEGHFEDTVIHRINEAYSSNRETDSKLEKEYRKAIIKKDYASALPIARSVARLQPDDAGAQTELRNTQKRYAKQLENKLDIVIRNEDIDAARKLLLEFDSLASDDYAGGDIVREARGLVQEANNARGILSIEKKLEKAPVSPEIGEWAAFEALYDEILQIKDSLTVPLPPELKAKWVAFCETEKAFRQKVTRCNVQRIALEKLKGVVTHAQSNRITGKQGDLPDVQASLEGLLSAARNAESLDVEIDEELQSRWHEEVTDLRARVSKMLKDLRRKQVLIGTVSVVSLILIGLLGYFFVLSSKVVSEADQILANKDLGSARSFVNTGYPENWLLGFSQSVKARDEAVREFIATDEADADSLRRKVEAFEAGKNEWSQGMRSMALADGELKSLFSNLEPLSQESSRPIRLELDRLENELAIIRNAFASELIEEAEKKLKVIESDLMPMLSLTRNPDTLIKGIEQASKASSELAEIRARGQGVVTISQDQRNRLESFQNAQEAAMQALEAHNDFADQIFNVSSVKEFFALVSEGLTVDYIGSPFYKQLVDLPTRFDENAFKKAAFASMPTEFSELIGANTMPPLSPKTALLSSEVDAYAEFRFNEMVDAIQFHEVVIPKPVRTVRVYSKGDVKDEGRFSTGDYMRSYLSGRLYFPHIDKGVIKYADYEAMLVSDFTSYGDLPELKMFQNLEVDDLLSSQREVLSSSSDPAPFLRLIDGIREHSMAFDDYKCFAIIQLFDMMTASDRPQQWGLSYLPNWEGEVEKLEAVGVENGDWLREGQSRRLTESKAALTEFFDGLSLENLSRVNRAFVAKVLDSEVNFYGHLGLDMEGSSQLYDERQGYALSKNSGLWVPLSADEQANSYLPLSPVVSISPSLSEMYSRVAEGFGINSTKSTRMAEFSGINLK